MMLSVYSALDSRMTDELGRIWKEVVVALLRYYPGIFLVGLMKTVKTQSV
jgi:hypothetical protein